MKRNFKEMGGDPRILNKTHKNNHKLSYDISLKKRYYKFLEEKYIDVGFWKSMNIICKRTSNPGCIYLNQ